MVGRVAFESEHAIATVRNDDSWLRPRLIEVQTIAQRCGDPAIAVLGRMGDDRLLHGFSATDGARGCRLAAPCASDLVVWPPTQGVTFVPLVPKLTLSWFIFGLFSTSSRERPGYSGTSTLPGALRRIAAAPLASTQGNMKGMSRSRDRSRVFGRDPV